MDGTSYMERGGMVCERESTEQYLRQNDAWNAELVSLELNKECPYGMSIARSNHNFIKCLLLTHLPGIKVGRKSRDTYIKSRDVMGEALIPPNICETSAGCLQSLFRGSPSVPG